MNNILRNIWSYLPNLSTLEKFGGLVALMLPLAMLLKRQVVIRYKLDLTKEQKVIRVHCLKFNSPQIHIFKIVTGADFVLLSGSEPGEFRFSGEGIDEIAYIDAVYDLVQKGYLRETKPNSHYIPTSKFLS